tara:strand:+ start:377 stop:1312 length:936 start_codon:yes stop_codon:yes gene_type:complete
LISLNIQDYFENAPSVVTVGTFDGVHLGHLKLIDKVISISKSKNLRSIILTFSPHPRIVLNNEADIKLLTTQREKNEIFGSYNIDYLLTQDFSKSFSKLSPIEFVRDILVKKLNVRHIVTGYDHHFGKNRNANSNQLIEFSKDFGYDVTKVDAFYKNKVSISSTKIRNLIIDGKINNANEFLGYQFILTGKVIGGLGRGKSLGFPTANILIDNYKIKPGNGVYYISSLLEGQITNGMMNVGVNPTFKDKGHSIEIHFFDFNQNLYDKEISIRVIKKIREEKKFDSADELTTQLQMDKKKCFELITNLKKTI